MSFENLNIPISVTTTSNSPIDDFFVPLLKEAVEYDVAVGYFTTGWIRDAAEGIAALASRGGHSRWIISPTLTEEDWEMLSHSRKENKPDVVSEIVERDVTKLIDELRINTRQTISWLVADGILEFRIAIPSNRLKGIFHAKIGVMKDDKGNKVAFSGSYNLTAAAETNWESVEVYSSLRDSEIERIKGKEKEFNFMWDDLDNNLEIYLPSDSALASLIKIRDECDRPYNLKTNASGDILPAIPNHFLDENDRLRKHQEAALRQWFESNGRGIFNMATGSGKTVTALAGTARLFKEIMRHESSLVVIVTVPYRHLAEQWREESLEFNFDPIMCFGDYPRWPNEFSAQLLDINRGARTIVFVITVNATYSGNKFQSFLSRISTNFLLIADEMHNLGASKLRKGLPKNAQFRMGLSATPRRKNDDWGSDILEKYFGEQVIEYGIKDAIKDGTLTEYYYYPVLIELTDDEMGEYRSLTAEIGRLYAQGKDDEFTPLKMLLLARARLLGGAENKIIKLKELLASRRDSNFNLVYVGDNKKDDIRQVESTLQMIGSEVGMKARKFTADEDPDTRKELITLFSKGDLQVLVAIRCLDEGVDIPRTETAYILASSTNPRQFIQRRGRVLRKAKGKRFAYIFDFITVPPEGEASKSFFASTEFEVERKLVGRELIRVNEFAESALNGGEALDKLQSIKKRLNLLDI